MTAFVNGGITDTAKKSNLDSKYGPYESVHAAYTALTSPTDYVVVGLTVGIQTNDGIVEYWFQNGTNESDLVLKVPTVDVPVQSVNSKTGDVVLDNTDVGAAATVHTHTVSDITNFPSLATVATSGNYSDLNGTPTLATVATTGSYSDLTNKPTIPEAQVQTDWDAESGISSIANKPTLATVATSGSYTDLSNKPEIPAAQIQSDWGQTDSSKKDFIKNKPTIPSAQVQSNWAETDQTAKSFIQNKPSLATVATTGAYSDLTGTPTIPAPQVQTDWNASSGMGVLLNKPTLATVATTGSYNDLTNRPNIPAAPVQADWTETDTTSLAYIQHKPTIPAAQVQSDWNQTNTSAPDYIKNKPAIAGAVQSDWTENDSTDPSYIQHKPTLATVATSGSYNDLTDQPTIPAAQIQSDWNQTDTTALDYIKNKPNIVGQAQSDWTENDSSSPAYILHKPTLATVATSGSYNDLSNKPTIPAAQVQTDWNATTGMGVLLNKPTLATVATSGDYEDLSNTPTIPTSLTDLDDYEDAILKEGDNYIENDLNIAHAYGSDPETGDTLETQIGLGVEIDDDGQPHWNIKKDSFTTIDISGDGVVEFPNGIGVPGAQIDTGGSAEFSDWLYLHNRFVEQEGDTPIITSVCSDLSANSLQVSMVYDDGENEQFEALLMNTTFSLEGDLETEINGVVTFSGQTNGIDYNDLSNLPTIPAAQIQSDWNQSDSSALDFIKNKPTIPSISGCEVTSNKVTSLTAQSTDTQYPSAKCVYDIVGNIESALTTILGV